MGHVGLRTFPKTRFWDQVVELLEDGAPADEIAAASVRAADGALGKAVSDPALRETVWLLTQLPGAAHDTNYVSALRALGIKARTAPSLMSLLAGFGEAVDIEARRSGSRTDLGEMARLAAATSLTKSVTPDLRSVFGTTAADVQAALAKLATPDQFARLSRTFFADLIDRSLEYYLSRAYADHVGPGEAFPSSHSLEEFRRALAVHCYEAALVVEHYSADWYAKTILEGRITREEAEKFGRRAFGKLRAELRHRSRADG